MIYAGTQRRNGVNHMTKTGFVKGMTIGVMAGAAIGMVMAPRGKNSKSAAGKALKAAGEVIDNITGIWS
jgi:gas vesicle protein